MTRKTPLCYNHDMLDGAFWATIITGVLALVGVIITNSSSNRKIEHQLEVSQAITDTKLENLTEEVRKHNNFAVKIPVVEQRLLNCENNIQSIKEVCHELEKQINQS